ncbi:MAG: XdhC family protein [Cyclobacteriaceae bacterium]|nr:XdhC family protein [Cyclobacteriaceae bacterium]
MKELSKILEAYHKTDFSKQKAALATVVRVIGSSYRSPGARMYLTEDGHWVGSISGGCLEGDALRKSRVVMQEGIPKVITYDTSEENNSLGAGLGCEGIIHVLLVPLKQESEIMGQLRWIDYQEKETAMATIVQADSVFGLSPGDQIVLDADRKSNAFTDAITDGLEKVLSRRKSFTQNHTNEKGSIEVFYELFEPSVSLMLFGGGYDAQPLSKLAHEIGFQVSVVDDCVAHLIPANFPDAALIGCKSEAIDENVYIKPYSAAVLMYHSYKYDYNALKALIQSSAIYIGILGPKKKGDKMIDQLRKEGVELTDFDLKRIHYPIGLDIGADTPEEIALSIIAEIKSVFSGRKGGMLRYRGSSIHDKDEKTEEVFKQVYSNERAMQISEIE